MQGKIWNLPKKTFLTTKFQKKGRLQHFQGHWSKILAICFLQLSDQISQYYDASVNIKCNVSYKTTLNILIWIFTSNNHHGSPCIHYQIRNHLHQIKDLKIYYPYRLGMDSGPTLSYHVNPNHNHWNWEHQCCFAKMIFTVLQDNLHMHCLV